MSATDRLKSIDALLDDAGIGQHHHSEHRSEFHGLHVSEGCWRCESAATTDVGLCQACADFLRSEVHESAGLSVEMFTGEQWSREVFGPLNLVVGTVDGSGYTAGGVEGDAPFVSNWMPAFSIGFPAHEVAPVEEQEWFVHLVSEFSEFATRMANAIADATVVLYNALAPALRSVGDSIHELSVMITPEPPGPPPKVRQNAFLDEMRARERRRSIRRH